MGKVEKVVVLGVLFSVVVILAVSLYSGPDDEVLAQGDPSARRMEMDIPKSSRLEQPARRADPGASQASDPGSMAGADPEPFSAANASVEGSGEWVPRSEPVVSDSKQRRDPRTGRSRSGRSTAAGSEPAGASLGVAERPRSSEADQAAAASADMGTSGLLSSTVRRSSDAGRAESSSTGKAPASPDPAWDLVTLEGLKETFDPRFQIYTCGPDEDFVSVAKKLYGSEKKSSLLRRDNEGVGSLAEGQELLVAVIDDRPGGGDRYEVQEGESLWRVANKIYGAGHRWTEIFEANRDTLKSPDAVRPGDVLVIP